MDTIYAVLIGLYCIGLGVAVAFTLFILFNQEKRMSQEFETKMAMAKAQSLMKDNATFEKIREDINIIIGFYVVHDYPTISNEIQANPNNKERLVEQFVSHISAKTILNMSDELKRQFGLYATIPSEGVDDGSDGEDFLTYFIRKETLTKVIARVEMNK